MRVAWGTADGGRAVDLRGSGLDTTTVLRAIRDPEDERVICPEPAPVHRVVGRVGGAVESRRRVLAAVARARGLTAPRDDDLAAVREELAALDAGATGTADARAALAEAGAERDRLRERAAALRGRIQARSEAGLPVEEPRAELAEVAARLSEVETERTAARQRLRAARRRAREGYDERERRLELQDRAGNLERAARRHLADELRPAVERAFEDYPGTAVDADPAGVDDVAFDHAAARLAPLAAPCVVTAGPFDAADAAEYLDAPVVRL